MECLKSGDLEGYNRLAVHTKKRPPDDITSRVPEPVQSRKGSAGTQTDENLQLINLFQRRGADRVTRH
jgi:hypothetical protein